VAPEGVAGRGRNLRGLPREACSSPATRPGFFQPPDRARPLRKWCGAAALRRHAPDPAPQPADQVNFTDPESWIMRTKAGCQQAYNSQAGVETAARLIAGPRVSQAANDQREVFPDEAAVHRHLSPDTLLVDSGFVSEAAVAAVKRTTPGLTILAALPREPHGRTPAQLESRTDQPAPIGASAQRRRRPAHSRKPSPGFRSRRLHPIFHTPKIPRPASSMAPRKTRVTARGRRARSRRKDSGGCGRVCASCRRGGRGGRCESPSRRKNVQSRRS